MKLPLPLLGIIGIGLAMLACSSPASPAPKPVTYTVTYNGNGSTAGSLPLDPNGYVAGATVTVLDNTGSLAKTGFAFAGWNTMADGSGTAYAAAATLTMGSAALTLYAQWTPTTGTGGVVVTTPTPVTVTLTGVTDPLPKGTAQTATASVGSVTVNSYAWYLDGAVVTGQTTSTFTGGSTLLVGAHSLMVVVQQGSGYSSTTVYFTVQ